MRVLVDIAHPAHVNFFKNALKLLSQEGHEIIITALRRGKLPKIVETELGQYPIHYVGQHKGTKFSIIVDANILKVFRLFFFVLTHKVDIGLSVGSFTLGAVLKLFGKPNLQFDDDPERKMNVLLEKLTSTRLYFPPIIRPYKHVEVMQALKEWAYLAPPYFSPNPAVLEQYGVKPKAYIFVREVSSGSLNYLEQQADTVASIARHFPRDWQVLLSLEDKQKQGAYPEHWTLLQEPLPDIHSLLYYSRMIISSGDSMAREGAMLGVPSIYVGIREMKANKLMEDRNMLFKMSPPLVPDLMKAIVSGSNEIQEQNHFRQQLNQDWVDVTDFILRQVKTYSSAQA